MLVLGLSFSSCKKDNPDPTPGNGTQFSWNERNVPTNPSYYFNMDNGEFWGVLRKEVGKEFYVAKLDDQGNPIDEIAILPKLGDIRVVDADSDGEKLVVLVEHDVTALREIFVIYDKGILSQSVVRGDTKHVALLNGVVYYNAASYVLKSDNKFTSRDSIQIPRVLSTQGSDVWARDNKLYVLDTRKENNETTLELFTLSENLEVSLHKTSVTPDFWGTILHTHSGKANSENLIAMSGNQYGDHQGYGVRIWNDQLELKGQITDHPTVYMYGGDFYGNECFFSGGRSLGTVDRYPGVMVRTDILSGMQTQHAMDTNNYAYYYHARKKGDKLFGYGSTKTGEFHATIPLNEFK